MTWKVGIDSQVQGRADAAAPLNIHQSQPVQPNPERYWFEILNSGLIDWTLIRLQVPAIAVSVLPSSLRIPDFFSRRMKKAIHPVIDCHETTTGADPVFSA